MKRVAPYVLILLIPLLVSCTAAPDEAWKSHRVNLDISKPQANLDSAITMDGQDVTINSGGVYTLSGHLSGGIVVNSQSSVKLVLQGAHIENPNGAAIYFQDCEAATITIADGTDNTLIDANEPNGKAKKGAIHSTMSLTMDGTGKLTIQGNSQHGIACEGELVISDCALSIEAKEDGIHADGNVSVKSGTITVTCSGDGIQSGAGIAMDGGELTISAQSDGIKCNEGFTLNEGGIFVSECYEGIQSDTTLKLLGGSLNITSRDDPLSAKAETEIKGGKHSLRGGDDGLDSNGKLLITGGTTVVFGTAPNYGVDCNENPFVIQGGTLVACGSNNSIPSKDTTQGSLFINGATQGLLAIESGKKPVLLMMLPRGYASVLVSSPDIHKGQVFKVTTGGKASVTADGLLGLETPYTVGSSGKTFTLNTTVNSLVMP